MTTQTLARLTDVDPLVHSVSANAGQRLAAFAVDAAGPVLLAAASVVLFLFDVPAGGVVLALAALAAIAAPLIGIARTGQSLGMRAAGTRVVDRRDGTAVGAALVPAVFSGRLATYDIHRGRDPFAPALSAFRFAEPAEVPGAPTAGPQRRAPILELDSHERFALESALVIGRNPSAPPDAPAELFQWPDLSRTLSKSHVRFEWDGKSVWATDLGSTNGTFLRISGVTGPLVPFHRTLLPAGAVLQLGDRIVSIRNPT